MQIAFYAPLKSPYHPVPSGDRRMARLMMKALRTCGHDVRIASRFRSYINAENVIDTELIRHKAYKLATRFAEKYRAGPPDIWFTYHCYHKAPDWLGPEVSARLNIPYVIAEPSVAPKQRDGPWHAGYRATENAVRLADAVFMLSPDDAECVAPLLAGPERLNTLLPFLDTPARRTSEYERRKRRAALADAHHIRADVPWLAVAAMMRHGDKFESYRILAQALQDVDARRFVLFAAGDGPARRDVEALFAPDFPVVWLGELKEKDVMAMYELSDIAVWPAIREAYGMALLEAQSAGLPAVAGFTPGVAQIVAHGRTGLLTGSGDAGAFSRAVQTLLEDPVKCRRMGAAAIEKVGQYHSLNAAANTLDGVLKRVASAKMGITA